ncbi:MAG TPA: hypothetical protein VG755_26115 [Nannocystaceae bacterium]|nr:hypothetical protein [Nannocystaceae bacterium]
MSTVATSGPRWDIAAAGRVCYPEIVLRFGSLFAVVLASACGRGDAAQAAPKGLVPAYLAIATTLAEDRTDGVSALANELQSSAAALSGKPGIAEVSEASKKLAAADITETRRVFESVSDGMVEYMRATADAQAGNVIVFCPMAFDNKGALWVQPEGKIANPYFGASMLRCGNKLAWTDELPSTAEP